METFTLHPIGVIRSSITSRKGAPRQGFAGGVQAWVELDERYTEALLGIEPGAEVILITWLHQSARDVMRVNPKWREDLPLTGVFFTRSPDRPNPLGLHRVRVLEIEGTRLKVEPLEAIDGTPVVDIKAVLEGEWDA